MEVTNAQQEIHLVLNELRKAKINVLEVLTPTNNSLLRIHAENALDNLINRFAFVAGDSSSVGNTSGQKFPPVTNFMGENIEISKPITRADLTSKEVEKNKILDKMSELQKVIYDLENKQVLENYSLKEDKIVLRGLAKRAGVEDYAKAEINEAFIQEIKVGLLVKEAAEKKEKENRNIKISEAGASFKDEEDEDDEDDDK